MVDNTLQSLGGVHQFVHYLIGIVNLLELRVDPKGILQGARLERHHAGDPVHFVVGHAQAASHVAQGGLCSHRAESDDLGDLLAAVFVDDVVQHFVSPVVLEVEVDVGHFLAFKVQEPFKDQPVFQGVDIGDIQTVEGDTGCRAAPHTVQDFALAYELDDVPNYQEVISEAGVLDHLQLILQPLHGLVLRRWVALLESVPAQLSQVFIGAGVSGHRVLGQVSLVEVELHIAHIGDQVGVAQRFREVREKLRHLQGAFHIVRLVLHAETLFILHRRIGLDTDVNVLQRRLRLFHVVSVVGNHQGDVQLAAQGDQALVDFRKLLHVLVMLQLKEVPVAEHVLVPPGDFGGFVKVAFNNKAGHFP